jgi:hypothetical protein
MQSSEQIIETLSSRPADRQLALAVRGLNEIIFEHERNLARVFEIDCLQTIKPFCNANELSARLSEARGLAFHSCRNELTRELAGFRELLRAVKMSERFTEASEWAEPLLDQLTAAFERETAEAKQRSAEAARLREELEVKQAEHAKAFTRKADVQSLREKLYALVGG